MKEQSGYDAEIERIKIDIEATNRHLRMVDDILHRSAITHRKPKRWIHMINDYINEMEWWQWLFFGLVCGLCLGLGLFS